MMTLAWKAIWRDRLRFAITTGGVALAVVLILVMNGLFGAAARQISLYIDQSSADLFVAQAGVRNMHMANSALPAALVGRIGEVAGVQRAEGIQYFPAMLEWRGDSDWVYVIGLETGATMGGPWRMAAGKTGPGPGDLVISDRQRRGETPGLGDRVTVAGQEFTVVGLSQETKGLASTLVFINASDAAAMRGAGRVNYILVRLAPGTDAGRVAAAIQEQVRREVGLAQGLAGSGEVSVITRQELSDGDRGLAMEMGVELLQIMAAVGFIIGLAVVTLTIYVATVEQLRQYGVLKAVGAGPGHLFTVLFTQSLTAAVVGFGVGMALTRLAGWLVPMASPGLEIDLEVAYIGRLFALILLLGMAAALPPYWRVQRVDPVDVFRA